MAKSIKPISSLTLGRPINNSIHLFDTNCNEVLMHIKELKTNKGIRTDDSPTKFIKFAANIITPFLVKFFNKCVRDGTYPDALKIAHVTPIHKSGPTDNCSNYRPISLLNQINKIFEKLIYKRLYSFLEKFNVLSVNQYGFRKNVNTAMAIYDLIENKICSLDEKNTPWLSTWT